MAEIIEMPKLSDTMTTGTLITWLKNEGDPVASGDMIAEVETDKATMEVEVFEDGVILKHYVQAGQSVAIGSPICAIGEKGESAPDVGDAPSQPATESEGKREDSMEEGAEQNTEPAQETAAQQREADGSTPTGTDRPASDEARDDDADSGRRMKASPLARKVAKDLGVSLSTVDGTGPGGRITRADVEKAAKSGPTADTATPAKSGTASGDKAQAAPALLEEKEMPVSNMRATIARILVSSKNEAPHFYLQTEVDGAPLAKLRKDLNASLTELPAEQGGVKLTINDLILRAAAEAVRRVPAINRSWQGKTIQQHGSVHLAFGVAVDDGLITPVIRDAHAKSLRQISLEAKDLIGKARNKKLKPDEMSGSTLTVTNLGMFGITDFYGIINPPNAAILSVGTTVKTPIVDDSGNITVGYRMKVGLSGDHRVIDGAVGAQYLAALREILETPSLMLV